MSDRSDLPEVTRVIVSTDKAAKPVGPYNQAVAANNVMYISGTLGVEPQTNVLTNGGIQPQTRQALENIEEILMKAGGTLDNVVKTTVLMTNFKDFALMNQVYEDFFSENYPARAAYQVSALPKGAMVEIEAVAVLGKMVDYDIQ